MSSPAVAAEASVIAPAAAVDGAEASFEVDEGLTLRALVSSKEAGESMRDFAGSF